MRRPTFLRAPLSLRALFTIAIMALLASCENAGADRTVGLDATGTVAGFVFFDVNGSLSTDAADVPFEGARVRLLSGASGDTLFRAETGDDGRFAFSGVPVGSYRVVLDSASAGDSARVTGLDMEAVTVLPADSIEITGSIGYPIVSAATARTLAAGTRVVVTGVALHVRLTFSDTLLHVVDTSGALRAMRVRPSAVPVAAGDSVRMSGRISARLGQPALDDVTVFVVSPTFVPTASTVTTAAASTAVGGTLDAALVRILDAAVTDTATVDGHLMMTIDDGSGLVFVRLDRAADAAFRPPFPAALYVAPNRFDVVGVLVPSGTGQWIVRPRSSLDLTLR